MGSRLQENEHKNTHKVSAYVSFRFSEYVNTFTEGGETQKQN